MELIQQGAGSVMTRKAEVGCSGDVIYRNRKGKHCPLLREIASHRRRLASQSLPNFKDGRLGEDREAELTKLELVSPSMRL